MPELSVAIRAEHRAPAFAKLGDSITYRQRSDSINRKTGTVTESNTDTTITALTSEMDPKMVANTGGKFFVGSRVFRIKNGDMPETPPDTKDEIIYDSNTFTIVEFVHSPDTNIWDLYTNKKS